MKIISKYYLRGYAESALDINEDLLKEINSELANYVIASDISKVPEIKTMKKLEDIAKAYVSGTLDDFDDFEIIPAYLLDNRGDNDIDFFVHSFYNEISFLIYKYCKKNLKLIDYDEDENFNTIEY